MGDPAEEPVRSPPPRVVMDPPNVPERSRHPAREQVC